MPQNIRSAIIDPLLTYKFLVSWNNDSGDLKVVAGVSKVGPLTRTTEVADYREGAAPTMTRKIPGQTKYSEIKLERGVILDTAFEQWANKVSFYDNSGTLGNNFSAKDFRRTLQIDLCNQAGQIVSSFLAYNCWPSEYTALPELNAQDGATVAVESMTLQNEGWVRNAEVSLAVDDQAQSLKPDAAQAEGVAPPE